MRVRMDRSKATFLKRFASELRYALWLSWRFETYEGACEFRWVPSWADGFRYLRGNVKEDGRFLKYVEEGRAITNKTRALRHKVAWHENDAPHSHKILLTVTCIIKARDQFQPNATIRIEKDFNLLRAVIHRLIVSTPILFVWCMKLVHG